MGLIQGALLTLSVTLRYGRHNFLVRRLRAPHGLLCTARQQGGSTHILGFAVDAATDPSDQCLRAHMAELGIVAAQGREGIKDLLKIIASE